MALSYIAAASLGLFLLLGVLLLNDRRRPANRYIFAYLAILALITLLRLSFLEGGILLVLLPYLVFPAAVLLGPLLWLYARSTLFAREPDGRTLAALLVAPVLVLLIHATANALYPEMLVPRQIQAQAGVLADYTRALSLVACVYNLAFVLYALTLLRRYRAAYVDQFSGTARDQLTWLRALLLTNAFLLVAYATVSTASWWQHAPHMPVGLVEGTVVLLTAYLVVYYYVRKPQVFAIISPPEEPEAVPADAAATAKYARQSLSEAARKSYLRQIEEYCAREKPYLDDDVTLARLSELLNIPPHHFSMVINIEKNMNFFNFINAYRVAEARALLTDVALAEEPILRIAYRAGFQSKAVFNRVFKEHTGRTPSDFRRQPV